MCRCTALPMLLAGVLCGGPNAADAAACIRRLAGTGSGAGCEVWALAHPQAFVEALRFAGEAQQMQAVLLEVGGRACMCPPFFVQILGELGRHSNTRVSLLSLGGCLCLSQIVL